MKGSEESYALCDAAFASVAEAVAQHIPQYDSRSLRYGFRRAWEIRDEMDRAALAQKVQPLTDEIHEKEIVAIVREADALFEKGGGGTRHWTRAFLELLSAAKLHFARNQTAQQARPTREQIEDAIALGMYNGGEYRHVKARIANEITALLDSAEQLRDGVL